MQCKILPLPYAGSLCHLHTDASGAADLGLLARQSLRQLYLFCNLATGTLMGLISHQVSLPSMDYIWTFADFCITLPKLESNVPRRALRQPFPQLASPPGVSQS